MVSLPPSGLAAQTIHAAEVAAASQRFGIPEAWIRAVMRAESAGDRHAVSHRGAMGLMQVMPATWAGLRAQHGLGADPFAPYDNILAGTAYLREMLDRFGSVPLMLAAYNAGPRRVEAHLATRSGVSVVLPATPGPTTRAIEAEEPGTPTADRKIKAAMCAATVGAQQADRSTPSREVRLWTVACAFLQPIPPTLLCAMCGHPARDPRR
ncbi:MAG: transglycosylase SLT domain-containing protein [Hyphomicrobiaceae bacterium]|nr:transglycosylase SLT domain-containing protein [Hyphomicrobiaceae bacterium]